MKVLGVIPARFGSTRLPGKPLIDILGKPMIRWVYQRAISVKKIDEIVVAIDDVRIEKVCRKFDIPAIMTSNAHRTAANRLQEVSEKIKADFYVQLNGDEPLINTAAIEAVIPDRVPNDIEFGTNIITEVEDSSQVLDTSNIKMVFDDAMNALYMSRTPIPFPFGKIGFKYYKHVGIIGYNKMMLDFYKESVPGKLELIEGIDTLRFLDYGKQLKLIYVPECHSLSVDTEKDLDKVREILKGLSNE